MKMEDVINQDIKNAMIEKNEEKLNAIRTIKSAIQTEKAKDGKEVSDEGIIKIIQKLVSQRTESAMQYSDGERQDLVLQEEALIKIFKTYLPTQLTEDEINAKIKEFILVTNASSIRDRGKVMALANKEFVQACIEANTKEDLLEIAEKFES